MNKLSYVSPAVIFVFFLSFYLLTFKTGQFEDYFNSIDGKVEYEQMQDILRGDFSLLVSPRKHLGLSLVQMPFYVLGEFSDKVLHIKVNPPFALLVNPIITALSCLVLFLIVNVLCSQKTSVIITFLYAFTTLAWPNAKSDIADPLLALCVLTSFWALLKFKNTKQDKWFVFSLLSMAAVYVTKLTGHVFILGWLLYVYIIESENKTPAVKILKRFFWIIFVWLIFVPVSINVNKAHAGAYGWNWFKEFWYKILVLEFSPFEGLFIYNPVLIMVAFSLRRFIKQFRNESILILSLVIPYWFVLHFGKEFFCIHDFSSRYNLITVPLLLIMLIPFIESFQTYTKTVQIMFFITVILGLYTQLLGSTVGILYYANLIPNSLGPQWRDYVFSWKYSPFGVYPFLIFKLITGIEIPINGFSNTSASILPSFNAEYFWISSQNNIYKLFASFLAIIVCYISIRIFKKSGILDSLKRYLKLEVPVLTVFIMTLLILFVPKGIFARNKIVPVVISNPGFEIFVSEQGKIKPADWQLIDWSAQSARPSVTMSPDFSNYVNGGKSLQLETNQDYVTISLASQPFDVEPGKIIQARCYVNSNDINAYSIRIAFVNRNGGYPFYYSATTRIKKIDSKWKELTATVLVPESSVKAQLLLNIWGVTGQGKRILFDGVTITKHV